MKFIDTILIKLAVLSDAPAIWKIQREAFSGQAQIYNNYQLPPLVQSLAQMEAEFKDKTFFKAEINREIVGSARFCSRNAKADAGSNTTVEIERLIEAPRFQNRGIGTHLMQHVEGLFENRITCKLYTGDKSIRNIHVYQKLGYTIYAHSQTPHGVGLVHMKKSLGHGV